MGGVFAFDGCENVVMDGVNMYGCGTEGLGLKSVIGLTVKNSSIYECTYQIMTVSGSSSVSFENCVFRDNRCFTMVNIGASENVSFTGCEFKNNDSTSLYGGDPMFNTCEITVSKTKFTGNRANGLDATGNINFTDCEFSDNNFSED